MGSKGNGLLFSALHFYIFFHNNHSFYKETLPAVFANQSHGLQKP